ncbi:MAG: hypothetical protein ACI8V2_002632, partial [Candidatus Latescibacterota bacterium]
MSKQRLIMQCVAALMLAAFFNFTHVQVAQAQNRAVVNAAVSAGGEDIILTVVGTGNSAYSGDGGPAVDGRIRNSDGVAFDGSNNLYILDHSTRQKIKDLCKLLKRVRFESPKANLTPFNKAQVYVSSKY